MPELSGEWVPLGAVSCSPGCGRAAGNSPSGRGGAKFVGMSSEADDSSAMTHNSVCFAKIIFICKRLRWRV